MRTKARVDSNHASIAAFFRAHGCEWESTARMGRGYPDALAGWQDRIILVEVKTPKGALRPAQTAFQRRFPVWLVRNDTDAAAAIAWLKTGTTRQARKET